MNLQVDDLSPIQYLQGFSNKKYHFHALLRFIDVQSDPRKLDEMLKVTGGKRDVPVIVEEGKVTIGYGGT